MYPNSEDWAARLMSFVIDGKTTLFRRRKYATSLIIRAQCHNCPAINLFVQVFFLRATGARAAGLFGK